MRARIKVASKNGVDIFLMAPENPDLNTKVILPNKSGVLATLEDIEELTGIDAEGILELLDQLEQNIELIDANTEAISENKKQIEINVEDIDLIKESISSNSKSITALEDAVAINVSDIKDNKEEIGNLKEQITDIPTLDGYTKKEIDAQQARQDKDFEDHEKRNVASFALIETELFRVAKEVVLNFNGILINEDAIKENKEAIKENSDRIDSLEGGGSAGEAVESLRFQQNTWDVNTNVDAVVNVCKMHVDKTAMVLNKDGLEGESAIDWEKELGPYPSSIGFGIDDEIYNLNVEFTGKAGQNDRAHNFKILSHNLPDDIANDTTVSIYGNYSVNDSISIEESKEDDKVLQDQIDTKASLSDENTFNSKQTFNKNLTVKGAETTIIPTLNSRWHKYSVNPPKNAEGGNDTSEAYGVNYYLDAGNTWKNQFKISNRNGTAFEVRGGSDMSGQLHSKWTYTGTQEEDNDIATVKYVKDAVGEGSASSTGYPPLPEYDFYYLSSAGTSAGRLTLHDYKGERTTDLSKVTLVAFSGVDRNGKRWARDVGAETYEKQFTGVLNLMTEEGKTVLKMCAGKGTASANLYYFKTAIADFVPDDCYLFEVIGGGGVELTSRVSEITYPQKLYLHVSGLHF